MFGRHCRWSYHKGDFGWIEKKNFDCVWTDQWSTGINAGWAYFRLRLVDFIYYRALLETVGAEGKQDYFHDHSSAELRNLRIIRSINSNGWGEIDLPRTKNSSNTLLRIEFQPFLPLVQQPCRLFYDHYASRIIGEQTTLSEIFQCLRRADYPSY